MIKRRHLMEQGKRKKRRIVVDCNGKRKIDHDVNTDLIVKLGAFVTTSEDEALLKPYDGTMNFRVVVHSDHGDHYTTKVVRVFHGEDLKFNQALKVPLDCHARYLYIELLRLWPRSEPGTSRGTVVMGRAKIRLPPPTCKITCKASLVALNSDRCVVEKGTLRISMQHENS